MYAKKTLGQNFLTSTAALKSIVEAAALTDKETVLEVGPGKGVLTAALLERTSTVIAVEKDHRLIPVLTERFASAVGAKRLRLVEGDILKLDLAELGLRDHGFSVVANIPYYITGELLRHLLSGKIQPRKAILLVQKEVAERIARSKKESILSLSVKAYGAPHYVKSVPRGSFSPAPTVDSAILSIENITRDFFSDLSESAFFHTVKTGFGQKRKQLLSNLTALTPREILEKIFDDLNLTHTIRAEDVPLQQWKSLVQKISPHLESKTSKTIHKSNM